MRQLFLPACLCLVTWSGPTASEPKLPLAIFTGVFAPKKVVALANLEPLADAVVLEIPKSFPAPLADIAIEIPVPSGEAVEAVDPEAVPLPPLAKAVVTLSHDEICDTLTRAAYRNDLPVPFFIRLLFQESGFMPGVVSPAGAQGIAQFMPETAADVGLKNPFDPLQAIPASARLLRRLLTQFGNLGLAAAAYNAGPRRIEEWLQKKGKLPQETLNYVKTITGRSVDNWKAAAARHPEQRLPRRAPCQEAAGVYAWNAPRPVRPAAEQLHRDTATVKTAAGQSAARKLRPRHKSEKIAQR